MDLQPASIEEDRAFLSAIDPRYQPPSHRTIMRSILPDYYQRVREDMKGKLAEVKYCARTTDLWTSRTTQGYNTITHLE